MARHGRTDVTLRTHRQYLTRVVDWLLQELDASSVVWRADCTWSVRGLIVTALFWARGDEPTLVDRFHTAQEIGRDLGSLQQTRRVSFQAFLKLLVRWTTKLHALISGQLRLKMTSELQGQFRTGAFVIFGVDGSRLELPRTAANEAAYSPSKRRSSRQTKPGKQSTRGTKNRRRKAKRARTLTKRQQLARLKKATSPQMWVTTMFQRFPDGVGFRLPP